jgi:hypothetical protein
MDQCKAKDSLIRVTSGKQKKEEKTKKIKKKMLMSSWPNGPIAYELLGSLPQSIQKVT